jgi:hypothetical protein
MNLSLRADSVGLNPIGASLLRISLEEQTEGALLRAIDEGPSIYATAARQKG